eukprot:GSMAST32.ASY1.ANO1.1483.1 assembled CDS
MDRNAEIKQLMNRVSPLHQSHISEIMYTESEINQCARTMAEQISEKYRTILKEGEYLIVVGLLNGAIPFMTNLVSHITVPIKLDYIAVHSYAGTESTGELNFRCDMQLNPEGQHVLVVDDILDTGGTLLWCKKHLAAKNPASFQIAVMLDKKERRAHEIEADYVGYSIPNKFVVGYGLDLDQCYRDLPFVAIYSKTPISKP